MANSNAHPPEKLTEEEILHELVAEEEARLARKRRRSTLFWSFCGLLLLAALVAQYFWFTQRDYVLQHAQIRPWLEKFCYYASCQLPVTRALDQLHVSNNFMGKHETYQGAVLLHFIFANQATFPQPYPGLEIRFEDEKNQVIGIRRLAPQEYLNASEVTTQLQPNQPVHVSLELRNAVPDMHTFGYSIHFL